MAAKSPNSANLAEEQVRVSLEQELTVIRGAVRAATDVVRLRTLDVLHRRRRRPPSAR